MFKKLFAAAIVASAAFATSAHAVLIDFTYTQTDSATGSGTISAFDFGGHHFNSQPMPAATVVNPSPGTTPAGFVGSQTALANASNEGNVVVGLVWSGSMTATATDSFTLQIPLKFVAKQIQTPTDTNDYNWNVTFGDNAPTTDTTSTSMRFAFWLGRDPVVDAIETPDTFQRFTQLNHTFVAGVDSFSNTSTTNGTVKDATDPAGAPAGNDAAGRDLAFYYGWRDQGALTTGTILINDFQVGGLLEVVPEPSSVLLSFAGASVLLLRRRRR